MDIFAPIDSKGTFRDVLVALTQKGVHRVPMLDKHSRFGRFVTQSEVLRFIATSLDEFGHVLDKTLLEARVGSSPVKKVSSSSSAIDAFKTMITSKVRFYDHSSIVRMSIRCSCDVLVVIFPGLWRCQLCPLWTMRIASWASSQCEIFVLSLATRPTRSSASPSSNSLSVFALERYLNC